MKKPKPKPPTGTARIRHAFSSIKTTTAAPPPPKPHPRWPVWLVAGFVVLIHVAWWLVGDTIVAKGGLAAGDSFTRLVRVERLVESGAWFDNTLPRANAPFGTSIHWTRPFDAALIALMVSCKTDFFGHQCNGSRAKARNDAESDR